MLGLRVSPNFPSPILPPIYASQSNSIFPHQPPKFPSLSTKSHPLNPKTFRIYAENGDGDKNDGLRTENGNNGGNGDDGKVENERPRLNIRWVDLLVDPDPDNIVAVGLTGLLTWASVQVLWQLFMISVAIVIAALKYSIVAALLVVILITLL